MDASQLTNIRRSRVVFADYSLRNAELQNPNNPNGRTIPRPGQGSSPRFTSSSAYTAWKVDVFRGGVNTTPTELQRIIQSEFPAPAPAPPPPPPSNGDPYSYMVIYTTSSSDNYFYKIYSSIDGWSAELDIGLTQTAYYFNSQSNEYQGSQNNFILVFYSTTQTNGYYNYLFLFISSSGTIVRQISLLENNEEYQLSNNESPNTTTFFYNLNPTTGDYDFQLYDYLTDTLQTTSLTIDYVNEYDTLINGTWFVTYNGVNYDHYIWNKGSNAPTLIATSENYDTTQINSYTGHLTLVSDSSFISTIYYVDGTGPASLQIYNIDSSISTYNNFNVNNFGPKGKSGYCELYNTGTSSYDFFVFNNLPTSFTPVILSNIGGGINDYQISYNYSTEAYQTAQTNHLAIINVIKEACYMNGGNNCNVTSSGSLYGGEQGGNYIRLRLSNTDNTNYQGYNINLIGQYVPNPFYGKSIQISSNYGWLVGTSNEYPHTSVVFTRSGEAGIDVSGYYAMSQTGGTPFTSFSGTYTTNNAKKGSYWVTNIYRTDTSGGNSVGIAELWYTVENSNWNSVTSLVGFGDTDPNGSSYDNSVSVIGSNYILCKALIGSWSTIAGYGSEIPQSNIERFLSNYVGAAPFTTSVNDFTTINLAGFSAWQQANGSNYAASNFPTFYPYIYDGNIFPPLFGEATGYVLLDGSNTFQSNVFTKSNYFLTNYNFGGTIGLNSTGVTVFGFTGSTITSCLFTNSGISISNVTSLSNLGNDIFNVDPFEFGPIPPIYLYSFTTLNNYFYVNFLLYNSTIDYEESPWPQFRDFIIDSNNVITYNGSNSFFFTTVFSGNNAMLGNIQTGTTDTIINGQQVTSLANTCNTFNSYPDFAEGILFAVSQDAVTYAITVLSTYGSNYVLSSNSALTRYINDSKCISGYLFLSQNNPFILAVHSSNGSVYTYTDLATNTDITLNDTFSTDISVMFDVYDPIANNYTHIVFSFSNQSFTTSNFTGISQVQVYSDYIFRDI